MVGDLPEVVGAVLGMILESEIFQDYRIIGNSKGTTVVLRYVNMDMVSGQRQTPVWKHRSGVNLTRDNIRLNTWIRDQPGGNGYNMESTDWNRQQNDSQHITSPFIWNTNAPVFQPMVPEVKSPASSMNSAAQTEPMVTKVNMETQTDDVNNKTVNAGSQCEVEYRSVGISCKRLPVVRSRHVQAVASSESLGISAIPVTQDVSTQCQKYKKRISTQDVGVGCQLFPQSKGRHSQTEKTILMSVKTNSDPVMVKRVAAATAMGKEKTHRADVAEMKTDSSDNGTQVHDSGDPLRDNLATMLDQIKSRRQRHYREDLGGYGDPGGGYRHSGGYGHSAYRGDPGGCRSWKSSN
jgi:hypothetical protein